MCLRPLTLRKEALKGRKDAKMTKKGKGNGEAGEGEGEGEGE